MKKYVNFPISVWKREDSSQCGSTDSIYRLSDPPGGNLALRVCYGKAVREMLAGNPTERHDVRMNDRSILSRRCGDRLRHFSSQRDFKVWLQVFIAESCRAHATGMSGENDAEIITFVRGCTTYAFNIATD